MKNKIIDNHPILGFITFNDLIDNLDSLLSDYNKLEDIIYFIMKNNKYDDEVIASLLSDNISNRLDWILKVLKDFL